MLRSAQNRVASAPRRRAEARLETIAARLWDRSFSSGHLALRKMFNTKSSSRDSSDRVPVSRQIPLHCDAISARPSGSCGIQQIICSDARRSVSQGVFQSVGNLDLEE